MSELEAFIQRVSDLAAAKAARLAVQGVMQAQERASGERWGVADVARHTGLSPNTIRAYEAKGILPPRIGRTWLKAAVLESLAEQPRPKIAPRSAGNPRQS